MIQLDKNKIFNAIKGLIFLATLVLVYFQLSSVSKTEWLSFNVERPFFLILVFSLLLVNLSFGFFKWDVILRKIKSNVSFAVKIQSFFAGIVTGMMTPNMLGNFIGRLYYFDRNHRTNIVLTTLFSNYIQFFTTVVFGCIALLFFRYNFIDCTFVVKAGLLFILLISLVLFLFGEKIVLLFRKKEWAQSFNVWLKINYSIRYYLFVFSVLRFLVYALQFNLALYAFGEDFNLYTYSTVWVVYFLMLFTPSLFMAKLGVKESVSIFILTSIGMCSVNVLFASLFIWFVNNLIPTLFGVLICKKHYD